VFQNTSSRWKQGISEGRSGELWTWVDHDSKCACIPILACSVNNAADIAPSAAYVVSNIPSDCHDFLHAMLISVRWVGLATWVPFFDNGTCVVEEDYVAFRVDGTPSGCHHFSSAHFGVRPSSD
jgi:hypothetical protein